MRRLLPLRALRSHLDGAGVTDELELKALGVDGVVMRALFVPTEWIDQPIPLEGDVLKFEDGHEEQVVASNFGSQGVLVFTIPPYLKNERGREVIRNPGRTFLVRPLE